MTLTAAYLTTLATQLASLSAFLGGFAATFLATLLVTEPRHRASGWAIGCAALASVAFIVAVVASTRLVAELHPDAPAMARSAGGFTRAASTLSFAVGLYALLGAIGCSGWQRSRRAGRVTAVVATCGAVAVSCLVIQVG